MQRFEHLHAYFTTEQWAILLGDGGGKLELILNHAVFVGLRNPKEPTLQLLTALYRIAELGLDGCRVARIFDRKSFTSWPCRQCVHVISG